MDNDVKTWLYDVLNAYSTMSSRALCRNLVDTSSPKYLSIKLCAQCKTGVIITAIVNLYG